MDKKILTIAFYRKMWYINSHLEGGKNMGRYKVDKIYMAYVHTIDPTDNSFHLEYLPCQKKKDENENEVYQPLLNNHHYHFFIDIEPISSFLEKKETGLYISKERIFQVARRANIRLTECKAIEKRHGIENTQVEPIIYQKEEKIGEKVLAKKRSSLSNWFDPSQKSA